MTKKQYGGTSSRSNVTGSQGQDRCQMAGSAASGQKG
jgi:hypothetical protein